jgi:hypothetical protein
MKVNYQSAADAIQTVQSNNRVFIHGSAATPLHLLKALFKRKAELKNVELVSISTLGDKVFNKTDFGESFFFNALFVSRYCKW